MERYKNGLFLSARVLFSLIFISGALEHLSKVGYMAGYAASMGVPFPHAAIVVTGLMLAAGSISILLGYKTPYGALVLILFLIPVTLIMHRPLSNPAQLVNFLKNAGLIGGAIYIALSGPGRYSIDGEKKK